MAFCAVLRYILGLEPDCAAHCKLQHIAPTMQEHRLHQTNQLLNMELPHQRVASMQHLPQQGTAGAIIRAFHQIPQTCTPSCTATQHRSSSMYKMMQQLTSACLALTPINVFRSRLPPLLIMQQTMTASACSVTLWPATLPPVHVPQDSFPRVAQLNLPAAQSCRES